MTRILRKQKKVDEFNFPYTLPSPYTGCVFGCLYCYSIKSDIWSARLKHWGIKPNTAKPKKNVVTNLKKDLEELQGIPAQQKEVQIGNFFDPYPPIEKNLQITRKCLEVFKEFPDWKVHLETKSSLILRDIDVMKDIQSFEAEITITTLTHDKHFEPYAESTQKRLEVIKELADKNIFTRVMIMPVLGKYTDINKILNIAIEYGAKDFKIKDLNYFTVEDLI